eukprot:748330-Hanusia_phi.AAC.2
MPPWGHPVAPGRGRAAAGFNHGQGLAAQSGESPVAPASSIESPVGPGPPRGRSTKGWLPGVDCTQRVRRVTVWVSGPDRTDSGMPRAQARNLLGRPKSFDTCSGKKRQA